MRRDPLRMWTEAWSTHGDTIHMRFGPLPVYFFARPEDAYRALVREARSEIKGIGYHGLRLLLGNGLITSDGDHWLRQRRLLQPLFTPTAVRPHLRLVDQAVAGGIERLAREVEAKGGFDLAAEMMRLTMSVISRVLFGRDLTSGRDDIAAAFEEAFAIVAAITINPLSPPLFVPTPRNLRFRASLRRIDTFIHQLIADAETDDSLVGPIRLQLAGKPAGLIRDEILTLFFAGFETTARTLAFAIWLLAARPDVAEALRAEADAGLPPAADENGLGNRFPIAAAVIHETLRLYPPASFIAREVREPIEVGGYAVPSGSLLVLSPHITHRHPDHWSDAGTFRPDRPEFERPHEIVRGAYFPFGLGPRVCLGRHLALMESILALARFAQRFEWQLADNDPVGITFHGTTRFARPVRLRAATRPQA